jgi:Xaa-Pro dipeptidase
MSPPTTNGRVAPAPGNGSQIDFDRLRAEHHRTCVAVMDDLDLDALVVGREATIQYVSGARRFWTEGANPFNPGCVMIAGSGLVYLMSTWADGVPAEIGHDQLYGMTWNGATLAAELAAIPGLSESRRIGVDAMTPGAARLLHAVAPKADIEDASAVLTERRRIKTPDEQACIRVAATVADSALAHALAGLRPGVRGRELTGRVAERMAGLGVTTPDLEAVFSSSSPGGQAPVDELPAGALVSCHVGAIYAGYEGEVVRTWLNPGAKGLAAVPTPGQRSLAERWRALFDRLMEACRPGGNGTDLLAAYEMAGEPLPSGPVAHGVGLGMEPPLIGDGFPADAGATTGFAPGMVLFVSGQVVEPEVGTIVAGETILITEGGHELLTVHGHGPLGGGEG